MAPPAPFKSIPELFFGSFEDTTIMILVIAATVSIVLGVTISDHPETAWIEGVAIFMAVVIVATVTSVNEYQKEQQFRKLNDIKNNKPIKVVRGSKEEEISVYDVLVGDVIKLETGDAIPCDGLYISGHGTPDRCRKGGGLCVQGWEAHRVRRPQI